MDKFEPHAATGASTDTSGEPVTVPTRAMLVGPARTEYWLGLLPEGMQRFARFAVVGGASFLLNLLILWLCTGVLGWHYEIAVVVAFVVVNLVAFGFNRRWSFAAIRDKPLPQLLRYYLVMLGSLLASLLLMYIFVEWVGMNYLLANAVAAAVLLFGNFAAHAMWTFRSGRRG